MIAPSNSPAELNSCIYEGIVTHRRVMEFEHKFQYRLFQLYLDLDELDRVFEKQWLWSTNRFAPARFRRTDHLGNPKSSLKQSVQELVHEHTGDSVEGPIRLLTNLRYYGFQMNPVSFYYCFDQTGHRLTHFIAEVSNTPWCEQHCYVFRWPDSNDASANMMNPKEFHVSPFLPMEMEYRWNVTQPTQQIRVHIQNYQDGKLAFDAGLTMQRVPINSWNLNTRLIRFPSMTGKVFAGIYWQALKLWWKGATYHPHPKAA